jgi:glycosyltransferase involved in cell wall biosynthesis
MSLVFWLSAAVFLVVAYTSIELACGARRIGALKDVPPAAAQGAPAVSVIVAALDEADTIEPALRSLLSVDYPDLDIIAVNDRSTDATGSILDRLCGAHPRMRVLHLDSLPAGWLGKNHALHRGALLARGEYLLFTDADVIFDAGAIGRAVSYCERHRVDHLTLLFDVVARPLLLRMLMISFAINFMARFKPWKVNDSPRHFLGAGGFNMVRRKAYVEIGGHAAIPLAVLDDMVLGKRIKSKGYRQHVLQGQGMVRVEWYRNAGDMARGMRKNIFAAFDYRIANLAAATLLILALRVWPWAALFVTDGATRAVNAATVLVGLALCADLLRASGWGYRCMVFAPIVSLAELAIWWRGCVVVLLRGAIEWRGTRYPLEELRRNRY